LIKTNHNFNHKMNILWLIRYEMPGKSYWRARLSTVDLLVLTSINQLLFTMKILFTFYKTSYLNKEANCSEPFPSVSIPWKCLHQCKVHSSFFERLSVNKKTLYLSLRDPFNDNKENILTTTTLNSSRLIILGQNTFVEKLALSFFILEIVC